MAVAPPRAAVLGPVLGPPVAAMRGDDLGAVLAHHLVIKRITVIGHGLPLALCTTSASPAEVKLVAQTVDARFIADVPERLIGDKAYDSDRLDEQMMGEYGTAVIAPHRCNRRPEHRTQDGRVLRRYRRRWKIQRLFAWLFNFRRLVVRYEYHAENFLGFLHLGCALILLKHLSDGF